jgi:hypothetical protein
MVVFTIRRPQPRHALQRARHDDDTAVKAKRAVDLLARAGQNLYVADFKLAQVRVAYRWYRVALSFFVVLGLTILGYVILGTPPGTT